MRPKVRQIVALFLVGMWMRLAFATSIVFVHYPGGYAVGADSRRVEGGGKESVFKEGYAEAEICKLRLDHGVVLATYGSAGWIDGRFKDKSGTEHSVQDLRAISDKILYSSLGGARADERALRAELSTNKPFLRFLAGMSIPKAGWVFIDKNTAAEGALTITSDTSSGQRIARPRLQWQPATEDALAVSSKAKAFLAASLPKVQRTRSSAISEVRGALAVAASEASDVVAPPFSILTVDSEGVRWIDKGACR